MRESVLLAPCISGLPCMGLAPQYHGAGIGGAIFTLLIACQCTKHCRILQSNFNQVLLLQHDMMLHCVSNRKLCFSAKCWSSPLPSRHSSSSTLLSTTSTARTTSTYFLLFAFYCIRVLQVQTPLLVLLVLPMLPTLLSPLQAMKFAALHKCLDFCQLNFSPLNIRI